MAGTNGDFRAEVQELLVEVAVLKTRLSEKDKALDLQAKEYERRLDDLNHAHALARDTLVTYLPREIFEKDIKELNEWRRIVDADRSTNNARNSTYTAILSIMISLATAGAVIWKALS